MKFTLKLRLDVAVSPENSVTMETEFDTLAGAVSVVTEYLKEAGDPDVGRQTITIVLISEDGGEHSATD